jgi:hypothetical protein
MPIKSLLPAFLAIALFCWGAPAEAFDSSGTISGTTLGFLFDPTNGLLPILGIPGAALLGAPLSVGIPVGKAEISPLQNYALIWNDNDISLIRLKSAESTPVRVTTVSSGNGRIALSPSGTAAAVYDAAGNSIQVLTGLPDTPSVARNVDLSGLSGDLTLLAISDDAGALLAGFSGGDSGAGVFVNSDSAVSLVPAPWRASAAAFLTRSRDAIVASQEDNSVFLVRNVTGAAQVIPVAGERDGITRPSAVAVSQDNSRAFIVNSGSALAFLDLAGGLPTLVSCPCSPTGLHLLDGNSVFRLTDASDGPTWLLDGDASAPRTFFVPPYRPAPDSAEISSTQSGRQ